MKGTESEKHGLPTGQEAHPTINVCTYCGRNNNVDGTTTHCLGCGTEFETPAKSEAPSDEDAPVAPPDTTWRDHALQYVGTALLIFFLYVMSLGPAMRFSCKTTVAGLPAMRLPNNSTVVSSTMTRVIYPRWVGICYHPVFVMFGGSLSPNGKGNVAGAYGRYLQWCQPPLPKPNPPVPSAPRTNT